MVGRESARPDATPDPAPRAGTNLRDHLGHALVDLRFGYVGEAAGRIRIALFALDEADRPSCQDIGSFGLTAVCWCDAPRSDCCSCDQGYALIRDPRGSAA